MIVWDKKVFWSSDPSWMMDVHCQQNKNDVRVPRGFSLTRPTRNDDLGGEGGPPHFFEIVFCYCQDADSLQRLLRHSFAPQSCIFQTILGQKIPMLWHFDQKTWTPKSKFCLIMMIFTPNTVHNTYWNYLLLFCSEKTIPITLKPSFLALI